MLRIFITGGNGFVGKNVINYFLQNFEFYKYEKNSEIIIKEDIVFHFAGKAHDLKKSVSSNEYYRDNTDLTKKIFDSFLVSDAKIFIFLSSVKAVADELDCELTEDYIPMPATHYGKSKLLAEHYILSKSTPACKRVYILRPCMIHGPGNKGNLNLLYKFINHGFPWPFGSFDNKRSFCSLNNLFFILNELIENQNIKSGIYNISDDDPILINELVKLISITQSRKPIIYKFPKFLIQAIARIGDYSHLPFNTDKLSKLTKSYIVSNKKITEAMAKNFPIKVEDGLLDTLNSFKNAI
jgi:nucleoside-diphosphate-sugar epimerase